MSDQPTGEWTAARVAEYEGVENCYQTLADDINAQLAAERAKNVQLLDAAAKLTNDNVLQQLDDADLEIASLKMQLAAEREKVQVLVDTLNNIRQVAVKTDWELAKQIDNTLVKVQELERVGSNPPSQ